VLRLLRKYQNLLQSRRRRCNQTWASRTSFHNYWLGSRRLIIDAAASVIDPWNSLIPPTCAGFSLPSSFCCPASFRLLPLADYGLHRLAAVIGLVIGIGGYTFLYAKGSSYLTDNPTACANCHIMREHYNGGSRRQVHYLSSLGAYRRAHR
jgi:hypothetical protein